MQEVPHLSTQGLDQVSRARFGEANHVDDDVGPELADFPAERAGLFLGFSGELHRTDGFPGAMRLVRRPLR
jgi:hypothetical protein